MTTLSMEMTTKPTFAIQGLSKEQAIVMLAMLNTADTGKVFKSISAGTMLKADVESILTDLFTIVDECVGDY